jgi:hypothetical protein
MIRTGRNPRKKIRSVAGKLSVAGKVNSAAPSPAMTPGNPLKSVALTPATACGLNGAPSACSIRSPSELK